MELIINPLGFHCLRDKTYNETTRQVGTSLDSTVSIGRAEYVSERPLNGGDFLSNTLLYVAKKRWVVP